MKEGRLSSFAGLRRHGKVGKFAISGYHCPCLFGLFGASCQDASSYQKSGTRAAPGCCTHSAPHPPRPKQPKAGAHPGCWAVRSWGFLSGLTEGDNPVAMMLSTSNHPVCGPVDACWHGGNCPMRSLPRSPLPPLSVASMQAWHPYDDCIVVQISRARVRVRVLFLNVQIPSKAPPNPGEARVLGPGRFGEDPRCLSWRLAGLSLHSRHPSHDIECHCIVCLLYATLLPSLPAS